MTQLTSHEAHLLRRIADDGWLTLTSPDDPLRDTAQELERAGFVRSLRLPISDDCCTYVASGKGVRVTGWRQTRSWAPTTGDHVAP